jgi:hypothetical protein
MTEVVPVCSICHLNIDSFTGFVCIMSPIYFKSKDFFCHLSCWELLEDDVRDAILEDSLKYEEELLRNGERD